jgi:hypothetical protein
VTVIYEPPITLERGGLGIVDFGDPADDVMAVLTELLGPPWIDEIPYPGESIFPGSHWRVVRSSASGLAVIGTCRVPYRQSEEGEPGQLGSVQVALHVFPVIY